MSLRFSVRSAADWAAAAEALKKAPAAEEKVLVIEESFAVTAPLELRGVSNVTVTGLPGSELCGGVEQKRSARAGELIALPQEREPAMLFVNGTPAERSVWPREGTLRYRSTTELVWLNSRGGGWGRPLRPEEVDHLELDPADVPPEMDVENADVRALHEWDESTAAVRSFDRETGRLELASFLAHPGGAFDRQDYQLLNTRFALMPGHWYYDRSGRAAYYLAEADGERTFRVPRSPGILRLEGCENVRVEGLTLSLANAETGRISGLRAVERGGALQAEDCRGFAARGLTIRACAGHGIKCVRCRDVEAAGCAVEDCGAGGIFTWECENEKISQNEIRRVGLRDYSAIGIHAGGKSVLPFVLDGKRPERGVTELIGNVIEDTPYCAVTCSGGPHRIEANRVSRCMLRLRDGAAIYCSRGERTVMRANFVRGVSGDRAYAYYFDELSRDCLLEGNVSADVERPYHSHLTENVTLRDNVFLSAGELRLSLVRSAGFVWERNLLWAGGRITFDGRKDYTEPEAPEKCLGFHGDLARSGTGEICFCKTPLEPRAWGLATGEFSAEADGERIRVRGAGESLKTKNPYLAGTDE